MIRTSWAKDHFYGREGESLGGLHIGEIERIRNQTVFRDWSVKVVDGASIDDLSKKAIDVARRQYAEKNRRLKKEILGWSDKVFLNRARLTINDRITNVAILLLGKPEAEHFISPAQAKITWILKDRDGVEKDYEHFSCPIILSAQQVFKKIRNIVTVVALKKKLILNLPIDITSVTFEPGFSRDVTNIGHWGCGAVELHLQNAADFEKAKPLIDRAYNEN